MRTSRPIVAAWGLAAGMLWAVSGPSHALASPGTPESAAAVHVSELSPVGPALESAVTRAREFGADPDLLDNLVERARQKSIADPVILAWVERVEQVSADRLPSHPVLSRYLEGIAKSVPASRIDAAIEELVHRLELAAARVDAAYPAPATPQASAARLAAIDHGAYALGLTGVTETILDRSISLAMGDRDAISEVQSPVLTLGILVASGIQPEQSLEVVSLAWDHGYRGNDLERLGKAVGRLGIDGAAPPAEVMQAVLEMIGSDVSQEEVFQGLDDLNGREGYTLPGLAPGDDPTIRRGDTRRDLEPPSGSAPKDPAQPKPVGGRL